MPIARARAGEGAQEPAVTEDHGGGDDALAQEALLAVDIHEDRVEQFGALGEPDLERRPGRRVEHERHRIELPRLCAAVGTCVRAHVGDTVVGEKARDLTVDAAQIVGGEGEGVLGECFPPRAQSAAVVDDLVVAGLTGARERQRRLRHGCRVVAQHAHGASPRQELRRFRDGSAEVAGSGSSVGVPGAGTAQRHDGGQYSGSVTAFTVRAARTSDVRGILGLLDPWVQRRILLGKDVVTVYEAVQEFVVAEADGDLIGCGALHVMWEDLGEIRTLIVADGWLHHGVGGAVVARLEENARALGLSRLFCLTFEVDFFSRRGFAPIGEQVVDPDVYSQLLRSPDEGVAEFLDLAHVKPNTLGNTRMLKQL